MSIFIAEVSDNVGTGYEPGVLALLLCALIVPSARWWRLTPVVLLFAACTSGNVLIAGDITSWIGAAIRDEIGWSYYVRSFVAWNLPFVLAAALVPIIRRASLS